MKCEHCTRKECSKKTKTDDQENASVEVPSPAPESGEEKGEFHKLADAKIFLSDCLACDSCVSAEEGVQVAQQNAKDFLRVLNLNKKCDASEHRVLAVSVCPQSLPYFAAKFSLSVTDASRRLCGFLKSLGVHYVFDATIAADFSILESQKEFVRRFHQHSEEEPALPMLTSACPGWVRYAERVLGHPVTPHLCTARSPQQIMGSLVKDYFARRQVSWPCPEGQPAGQATSFHVDSGGWVGPGRLCGSCRLLVGPLILLVWGPGCLGGIWKVCGKTSSPAAACRCRGFGGNRPQLRPRPQGGAGSAGSAPSAQDLSADRIFHVIVAPCYDRKLEALQEDVPTASPGFRGTDCVLTSGEIAQMMEQSDLSVRDAALDTLFGDVREEVRRHDGASSDGCLAHIFRHAAKELFDEDVGELTYRALRNRDFQEVTLEKSGKVLLRFAAAYGFRNIQNVVLKLKRGRFPYHFVEVLACAGGCLNGRGQAQTEDGRADRALLQRMRGVHATGPGRTPETSAHVQDLYREWLDGADAPRARGTLHTAHQGPGRPADGRDIKW
uniref:Nuclear prelamin A recognition factor n=1 Tax=Sus scrofa TaxID=9823 RepID=A0A8D1RVR5_PIG